MVRIKESSDKLVSSERIAPGDFVLLGHFKRPLNVKINFTYV